jgi:hypothetical protein
MSKYTKFKVAIVNECYHGCPFFNSVGHEMQCDHPFYQDKSNLKTLYDNLIITQKNSHGRVPDECPLKNDEVTEVILSVRLSL